MPKLKVGIIGCGTIGGRIAKACRQRLAKRVDLIGISDIDDDKARVLRRKLKGKVAVLKTNELIKRSDLLVEAASAKISAEVLCKAIMKKKDILIMSIGGLLGHESLLKKAEKAGIRVYLPSGALCGIDGLKSASIGRIDSVSLTTRKPPGGLEGAPYIKENNIDLASIKEETAIFDGTAIDAVKGFPQNVNVSAILSLAGTGAGKTRVRVVTSPGCTTNVHEVEIRGEFGNIRTRTENVPSKENPKTSQLAVYSAIATLEGIVKSVRMGT